MVKAPPGEWRGLWLGGDPIEARIEPFEAEVCAFEAFEDDGPGGEVDQELVEVTGLVVIEIALGLDRE